MSRSLQRIAHRRLQLQTEAELQRQHVAQAMQAWHRPLAMVDQALSMFRSVSRHPLWLLAAAVGIATLSPGRTRLWLQRGWVAANFIYSLRRRSGKAGSAIN